MEDSARDYAEPRKVSLAEIWEEIKDLPLGPWAYRDERWEDDGYALGRMIRDLAFIIRRAGAAPEAPSGDTVDINHQTRAEASYLQHFMMRDHNVLRDLMIKENWTTRRIQKELLVVLRALIALDPEAHAQEDVFVAADDLLDVDSGRCNAMDLAHERLMELPRTETEGLHFRHGMALGIRMALSANDPVERLLLISMIESLNIDLGASASDIRPKRELDDRSKKLRSEWAAQLREAEAAVKG